MADHWQLAKRVMIWNDEPPLPEPGVRADATSALLSGIARALRAGHAAEDRPVVPARDPRFAGLVHPGDVSRRAAPERADRRRRSRIADRELRPAGGSRAARLRRGAHGVRVGVAPAARAVGAIRRRGARGAGGRRGRRLHRLGRDAPDAGRAVARRYRERERARVACVDAARTSPCIHVGREHADVPVPAEPRARRRRDGARDSRAGREAGRARRRPDAETHDLEHAPRLRRH